MHNRALSLYRTILRTTRTEFTAPKHKEWIFKTAREEFGRNRNLKNETEIDSKIAEGEQRLETALYYRIPYQRLEHLKHL